MKVKTIRQTSSWKRGERGWENISSEEYTALQGTQTRTESRLATFVGDPKEEDTWKYIDTQVLE